MGLSEKSLPNSLPSEIEDLIDHIGHFIEYWGFKRVQGKIWAYLQLSKAPLDTSELISRTKISKGLASLYLNEMLDYEVILEAGKNAEGRSLYRANPDQRSVIMSVLRRRERVVLSRISAAIRLCHDLPESEKNEAKISSQGIREMRQLVEEAETVLDGVLRTGRKSADVWKHLARGFKKKSVS